MTTNTNRSQSAQSATKPQSAGPVAYARAWVLDPSITRGRKLNAVTLKPCLGDDVPLCPALERDALLNRVMVLESALRAISTGLTNGQKERTETLQSLALDALAEPQS